MDFPALAEVLDDPCVNGIMGLIVLAVAARMLGIGSRSATREYQKPTARAVDNCTVEVTGDVATLQSKMHMVAPVQSWERIGTGKWLIHLQYEHAAYVMEAINIAQDGTI